MKTLKESILSKIDDTIERGQEDLDKAMNIDTLPTVNDFEKGIFNNKWHQAIWYCPNVIKRYRSKYPNMIPAEVDSIAIILDAGYSRVVDCNLYFTTNVQFGVNKLKSIVGWGDGYVGANLRKYKQMAIDVITKLAKNPDKMDKMLKYSYNYAKYWAAAANKEIQPTYDGMRIKHFNEL